MDKEKHKEYMQENYETLSLASGSKISGRSSRSLAIAAFTKARAKAEAAHVQNNYDELEN